MTKPLIHIAVLLLSLGVTFSPQPERPGTSDPNDYKVLLNKKAPEWIVNHWVNSEPLKLDDLKGKVVLVRWWLETCPYCKATAPSLNEFYSTYKDKGLEIIGMYHPKPLGKKVNPKDVQRFAEIKGFEFPIAIDQEWKSLRAFWPKEIDMSYTSVSFLIDREGIIRYIHPGGSYNPDALPFNMEKWKDDYYEIKSQLKEMLD